MVMFQVHWDIRHLSPNDGQAKLAKISEKIKQDSMSGFNVIKLDGVTLHSNPFPEDLQKRLTCHGLVFDDINFCYQKKCESLDAARNVLASFEAARKEQPEIFDGTLFRVMDGTDDLEAYESF